MQAGARWQVGYRAYANAERAKGIMRRVAGRWRNREASDAVREWHGKIMAEKQRARGVAMMRRASGRWKHKELAINFYEWLRSCSNDRVTIFKNRAARVQQELATVQMKFVMVTQVST